MAVGDICKRDVVTVFAKETVADAARLMRDKHVGSLVVMRPSLLRVRETDSIGLAAAIMRDQGVRRLPVVDAEDLLVGLVAADDLLELLADEVSDLATVVSRGMQREAQERAAAAVS